ncbi:MAG: helix-turn-helix domain-containing protein [Acidimicrobiales bacterium]
MQWIDDGRGQVNAVKTTGIYCRAGCAGRPNPENVARLGSPVEAEVAGYRSCLRCRSDELPIVTFKDHFDPLVARALLQICNGYLDAHTEQDLAASVGASARHLRRLFALSIGATPSEVARSRRSHFARLLLDGTDLAMTDVAYASGFGSQRRMNDVMIETFKFTPTELRARRRRRSSSSVDGGLKLRLSATRAIEFERIIDQLGETMIEGVESISDRTYRRTTEVCGHPGVIEISCDKADRELIVVVHLPTLAGLINEVAKCRRLVRLDAAAPGPPGGWGRFETAVRSLFETATGRAEARKLLADLAASDGGTVPGAQEFGLTRQFPAASKLATAEAGTGVLNPSLARDLQCLAELELSGELAAMNRTALDRSLATTAISPQARQAVAAALLDS